MKPSRLLLILCATLYLSACNSGDTTTQNASQTSISASAVRPASETAPIASNTSDAPPASATASSDIAASSAPTPQASETATFDPTINIASEVAAPPAPVYYGHGMHPICDQYLQDAQRCFTHAPEPHRARLITSLQASRSELMGADGDTCSVIKQQFDEWASSVNCH